MVRILFQVIGTKFVFSKILKKIRCMKKFIRLMTILEGELGMIFSPPSLSDLTVFYNIQMKIYINKYSGSL